MASGAEGAARSEPQASEGRAAGRSPAQARAGGALVLAAALLAAGLPAATPEPEPCHEGLVCGRPVDLNAADAALLEALPGIGPVRARAIVAARPFGAVDELERVPGIGPRTLRALRPWLEIR